MTRILLLVVITLSGISCHKECIFPGGYVFELPATLSPAKDTFRIGDTITFVSEFSNQVYDRATKQIYSLNEFYFSPFCYINKIDVPNSKSNLKKDFEIFNIIGNDIIIKLNPSENQVLYGQYIYFNNRYLLSYKLIPKTVGLFYFKFGSSINTSGQSQDFDGRCPKRHAGLDAFVKMNDGADNNIQMLLDSPDPHYRDWIMQKPEERFHKFGGYCFYVKE